MVSFTKNNSPSFNNSSHTPTDPKRPQFDNHEDPLQANINDTQYPEPILPEIKRNPNSTPDITHNTNERLSTILEINENTTVPIPNNNNNVIPEYTTNQEYHSNPATFSNSSDEFLTSTHNKHSQDNSPVTYNISNTTPSKNSSLDIPLDPNISVNSVNDNVPSRKIANYNSPGSTTINLSPAQSKTPTSNSSRLDHQVPPPKKNSYQVRALLRSKLSYQKRQYKVNFLCVAICPFMMVAVGGIFGIVLRNILTTLIPRRNYVTCSNTPSITAFNMPLPRFDSSVLPNITSSSLPNSIPGVTYQALNMYILPFPVIESINQIQTSSLTDNSPSCVWSFDKNYKFSSPYQFNPDADTSSRMDTTIRPDPHGGWLNTQVLASNLLKFQTNQNFPWFVVKDSTPGLKAGNVNRLPPIPISIGNLFNSPTNSIQSIVSSNSTNNLITQNNATGLLSFTDTKFFLNFSPTNNTNAPYIPSSLQPVPWFDSLSTNSNLPLSDNDIDDIISNHIIQATSQLRNIDPEIFRAVARNIDKQSSIRPLMDYFSKITPILTQVPWGALLFNTIDPDNRIWSYTMQIGSNGQISNSGSFPSIITRLLTQQTSLSNAFLKSSLANKSSLISQSIRGMPQIYYHDFSLRFGSILGTSLYPFGISFMISVFVLILVKEKENRILIMMQMNGLKIRYYYLAHFIHFFILTIWSSFFFILAGIVFKLELFTKTSLNLLALIMVIWSVAQISLSFFLSTFFKSSRSSQILTYLIILWGVITDAAISLIYPSDTSPPLVYLIWPPFSMYRILSSLNSASISADRPAYSISDLVPGDNVFTYLIALSISAIAYLLLAFYTSQILPSATNARKPWHFIFSSPYKYFTSRNMHSSDLDYTNYSHTAEEELAHEDSDVKLERQRVLSNSYSLIDHNLVLNSVRKVYPSGKIAVKDVSVAIETGTIFGLLGPNGSGKTSLISIIAGMHPISSGKVTINGVSIESTGPDSKSVGVCPQHDILFDDLSISDHAYFYARLKGVHPSKEKAAVDQILQSVQLFDIRNRLAKYLSGGEKRRLSMAISLIGDPQIVIFDEPTTGLDPKVRRTVWNIINSVKNSGKKTI
ncbi:ABC transporter A family member 9, partial [Smittium culicis]